MLEEDSGQVETLDSGLLSQLPVGILMTANDRDNSCVVEAMDSIRKTLPLAAFLVKPFGMTAFLESIKDALHGREGDNIKNLLGEDKAVVNIEDDIHLNRIVGDILDNVGLNRRSFLTYNEAVRALQVEGGKCFVEIDGSRFQVRLLLLDLLTPGEYGIEDLMGFLVKS
ncbi:MAG: hypothetical protein Q8P68_04930 [Candidatus Peregrinibacteria bacterium]|nr:hypothetical protein [Candidatus Peregrinibacteria bacterium]